MQVVNASAGTVVNVNAIYGLTVSNILEIEGMGVNNTGALLSVSGINTYSGDIELGGLTDVVNGSIGVQPDPRPGHATAGTDYFTFDHSLTVTGTMTDWFPPVLNARDQIVNNGHFSNLTKFGRGHLILPFNNTYSGKTDITAGWVTIRSNNSLGTKIANQSATNWQPVTVSDGAALHLKPLGSVNAPTLVHDYELNGSFSDSISGPDLAPQGGTLNSSTYTFGPNQGLKLTDALGDTGNYSIEMRFNIDDIDGRFDEGFVKLLDFKDRTDDDGLYNFNGALTFFGVSATGPSGVIAPGVTNTLLITRDGATKEVVVYLN